MLYVSTFSKVFSDSYTNVRVTQDNVLILNWIKLLKKKDKKREDERSKKE